MLVLVLVLVVVVVVVVLVVVVVVELVLVVPVLERRDRGAADGAELEGRIALGSTLRAETNLTLRTRTW